MNKKAVNIILNWLAVLAWMGVIYYFSAQPDLKSELEPMWDTIFRKIAHLAEFFILAYLFFRALSPYAFKPASLLLVTCLLSLTYAGFDEWHQGQVAGRVASLIDVGIDSVGVLVFVLLQLHASENNNESKFNF